MCVNHRLFVRIHQTNRSSSSMFVHFSLAATRWPIRLKCMCLKLAAMISFFNRKPATRTLFVRNNKIAAISSFVRMDEI